MKTTNPFSESEIEKYIKPAFAIVDALNPMPQGRHWDIAVMDAIAKAYSPSNPNGHDAQLFAELIFEGYYEC